MKHTDPQDLQTTDRPVEKLLELADYLEKFGEKFTMLNTYHPCGTPACIAGHWAHLQGWGVSDEPCMLRATKEMGLKNVNEHAHALLFGPHQAFCGLNGREATAADAAKVIRHFALTGEEDWSVAL